MIQPGISVIVVTYNSGTFLKETLESIKAQDLKPSEIIISDDGSTDATKEIALDWLEKNKETILISKFIGTPVNTGISANLNRGLNEASGPFIKFIAGDDLLLPNCLRDNYNFINSTPDASFIFSNGLIIDEKSCITGKIRSDRQKLSLDNNGQFRETLKSSFVLTPSVFIRKEALVSLGGYNENSRLLEDYPMWLKALRNGYRFYYLDKETVSYRKHSKAASLNLRNRSSLEKKIRWMETITAVYDNELIKDIARFRMYGLYLNILFTRKALEGWQNGNKVKFRFYSVLRMIEPTHLAKHIYRTALVKMSQLKKLFSGNGKR